MKTTEERVKQCFALQFGVSPTEVLNDHTVASLGGDSLDHVEIVMEIEDEFGFEIQDEEAEKLTTVQSVIDHVEGALK